MAILDGGMGTRLILRMLAAPTNTAQAVIVVRKPHVSSEALNRNGPRVPTIFLHDKTSPYATDRLLVVYHSPKERVMGL